MVRRARSRRRTLRRIEADVLGTAVSQGVTNTSVGGSLVQEIHIGGDTALERAARRLAVSVDSRVAQETGQRSLLLSDPLVLRVRSAERRLQARGRRRSRAAG
jgi:hypothetical protein